MFLDHAGIYQSERKLTIQHYVKNGDFRRALEKNVNFSQGFLHKINLKKSCMQMSSLILSLRVRGVKEQ
jgi:hypothetical protein